MALLTLRVEPDPILAKKTEFVDAVDDQIRQELCDMLETMYASDGIGLAANQVGISKRMFVMDVSHDPEKPEPMEFINPEILWLSEDKEKQEEGCLSVPGVYAPVIRSRACRLQYLDKMGQQQILEAEGLMAVCIQHEIDHLEGILFVDRLSHLKRQMVIKKSRKIRQK